MEKNDLRSMKVLVTPRSFGRNDPKLKETLQNSVKEVVYNPYAQTLTSAQVKELLVDCDGFIAGVDTIDKPALENADKLKVIARYGVGVDKVDLQAAKAMGITVTNTPLANAQSVAELALGFVLSLLRKIPQATQATRSGSWPQMRGYTLEGKSVGLVGFGTIGKKLARILTGFDCQISAYDPYPDMDTAKQLGVKIASLEEVIQTADIVSLHIPSTPETAGLVNQQFIASMKPGAFLVNTSRGEIVDEGALIAGVESGHLAGAGLDVLSQEPPDPHNPILKVENILVTPHSGAHTDGATNAMG